MVDVLDIINADAETLEEVLELLDHAADIDVGAELPPDVVETNVLVDMIELLDVAGVLEDEILASVTEVPEDVPTEELVMALFVDVLDVPVNAVGDDALDDVTDMTEDDVNAEEEDERLLPSVLKILVAIVAEELERLLPSVLEILFAIVAEELEDGGNAELEDEKLLPNVLETLVATIAEGLEDEELAEPLKVLGDVAEEEEEPEVPERLVKIPKVLDDIVIGVLLEDRELARPTELPGDIEEEAEVPDRLEEVPGMLDEVDDGVVLEDEKLAEALELVTNADDDEVGALKAVVEENDKEV